MEERIKEILDEHDNEEDLSNDFNFGQEEEKGNAKPLNSRTDNDRGALKIDKSTFRPNLGKSTTSSQQKGTLKSKLKLGKHREELKESPNILKSKKGYEGVQINMGDIELTEGIKNHPGSQYKKNHLNIKDEFLRESDRSSVPDRLDDQTRRARENNPEATFEERNTLKPEEPLKSDRVREIGINENDQEMQMFSERETELGYWGFLRSAKVQLWKKVGVVAYLILFLLSLVMSTIELIRYSESGCKRGLLITILYYVYFGFGIIFKFSFYIFTQMEYHGKIAYKWKVTPANQVPHLIPLSMVLVSISFQIGYYSYDYGLCQSINLVFTDPTSSELLSSRVAITILIYILLYLISLVLKSMYPRLT